MAFIRKPLVALENIHTLPSGHIAETHIRNLPFDFSERIDQFIMTKTEFPDPKIIGIYTEAYNFIDLRCWQKTILGKQIMKFLHKKKFNNYLKFVLFDSRISRDTVQSMNVKVNQLDLLSFFLSD